MKRFVAHTLLFLPIGAVTNVAVAWACALYVPARQPRPFVWPRELNARPKDGATNGATRAGRGTEIGVAVHVFYVSDCDFVSNSYFITRAGFPMKALTAWQSRRNVEQVFPRPQSEPLIHGGIVAPAFLRQTSGINPCILPFRPIWPGFAVNTAVFAAGLAAPILFVRVARSKHRALKHLCITCGYPIAAPTCPECGTPITPHAQAPA